MGLSILSFVIALIFAIGGGWVLWGPQPAPAGSDGPAHVNGP